MEEDWATPRYEHYPMKKLIKDKIPRRPHSRKDGPSIVARLMGMEMLPLETKSTLSPIKKQEELIWCNSSSNEKNTGGSIIHRHSNTYSFEHEFDPIYDHPSSKPKRREHPQEEELQKFKKEFEVWQAAMFKECCRHGEGGKACTLALDEEHVRPKSHLVHVKSAERRPVRSCGENQELYVSLPSRARYGDNETVPNKIVVLKPGPDGIWSSEDSRTSFSGSSDERGSVEDLLEEVKERLKQELQGKNFQKGLVVPRNRIRESVRRRELELGPGLVRSESTRSHKSDDIQLSEINSPEFIRRDTRRLLAERLENVLKREMDTSDFSRSCLLEEKRVFQNSPVILNTEQQRQLHGRSFLDESLSPKNLVRSLSAPVSRTSFGKLLEDPHAITGARIGRNREHSTEKLSAGMKNGKKETESFSIRSTFGSRGRLPRKRMASMADLHTWEPSFSNKDIWSGPTVILQPGEGYVRVPCTYYP
ncbi:hypothetical protein SAY87_028971 [Trapa incisa]|uniref:DUF3741 domain-containing protein n=1 Tax=Trapa incisa TaxID=236973 RepID=A0AAN7KV10_9MYRT|nr:hypothetical protein SAY87_028971 [Trapa incisa]